MVYYKEPQPGRVALADGFTNLSRLDFVEVRGRYNNCPEFAEVAEEVQFDDDPFADVDEKEVNTRKAIVGNRRGLEILSVVAGTTVKSMLTESEITAEEERYYDPENPFGDEELGF